MSEKSCDHTDEQFGAWINEDVERTRFDNGSSPVSATVESYSAPLRRVEDYADEYADHWRGRSSWYWMWRLTQEVAEALGVLIGVHDDDLDHELTQIASICVNWQRKRGAK